MSNNSRSKNSNTYKTLISISKKKEFLEFLNGLNIPKENVKFVDRYDYSFCDINLSDNTACTSKINKAQLKYL